MQGAIKGHRPIPAKDLVGRCSAVLRSFGFVEVHKSANNSRYLRLPPEPFTLRISNHAMVQEHRQAHPQVVRSAALQPVTENEIYMLAFDQAIRYLVACEIRRMQARRRVRRRS